MSESDAFVSLPEAHLMQFITFGDTFPAFPAGRGDWDWGMLGLHFTLSIPLDKLFQRRSG